MQAMPGKTISRLPAKTPFGKGWIRGSCRTGRGHPAFRGTDAAFGMGDHPVRKKIAVLDCAVVEPEIDAFNHLVSDFDLQATYHPVVRSGFSGVPTRPDFVFIFGSEASVNDSDPWIAELVRRAREFLVAGIPAMGICFGHQLAVRIFESGEVGPVHRDQRMNFGTRPFRLDKSFGTLDAGSTLSLAHRHGEEIKALPDQCEVIGSSELVRIEMIRHRHLPYVGVQGHPEAVESFFHPLVAGGSPAPRASDYRPDGDRLIQEVLTRFSVI